MEKTNYEWFMLALVYMLGQQIPGKRNTQVNLAASLKMSPVSLNAIIKRRVNTKTKKETRAGEATQNAIAEYYGMDIQDFMQLGKRIQTGQQPANILLDSITEEPHDDQVVQTQITKEPPDLMGNILPVIKDFTNAFTDIQKENSLLRSILNHLPWGIVLVDPHTKQINFQNKSHRELSGNMLTGKKFCPGTDFCIACQAANLGIPQAETLFNESGFNDFLEAVPLISSSGEIQAVLIILMPGQDDSGLYEQVMREQTRLNLFADSFKLIGVTVYDENMKIKKVNHNYTALTGNKPEEIPTIEAARKLWQEQGAPELDEIITASQKAWTDKVPSFFRATAARTGNNLIFYLTPLIDDSGQFYGVSSVCILNSMNEELVDKKFYTKPT